MVRFLIAAVVLVALVGGYVVGQQPDKKAVDPRESPNPVIVEQRRRDGIGVINDVEALTRTPTISAAVGRYVPAGAGRILDTTNGTLYAVSDFRWTVAVEFENLGQAGAAAATFDAKASR